MGWCGQDGERGSDHRGVTRSTFSWTNWRRLWPFAAIAVFGWLLVPLPGQPVNLGLWALSGGLTALVVAAVVLVPWRRLSAWAQVVPALVYLLAVAALRHATGGSSGGTGSLVLLPVVWMALHGRRDQLVTVIAGVAAVWALPLLLIGAPAYPAAGWRGCVLIVALSAMIGITVQRLVVRVREHAVALYASGRERERLVARLEALAATDPLTGLANRRTWDEGLSRALVLAQGEPVSVAMLDLDHLKALNDARGHHAGDQALADSAAAWKAELRPGDLLARIGGDEFALLLTACPLARALEVIERLHPLTAAGLTCSAGVVQWDGRESAERLLQRADALLYQAKRAGRARTASSRLAV